MPNFKSNHYVPILTWKQAEQAALDTVPVASRTGLTPLLEVVPIPVDLETGAQNRTLDAHINPSLDRIVAVWGTNDEFFLDPSEVALDISTGGQNGSQFVYAEAQARGLAFIPVTGIRRPPSDIAAAIAHAQLGVCLRLELDDLNRPTLASDITAFLATTGLQPSGVDLIIDLESVATMPRAAIESFARALLQQIPNQTAWRTVTLAGCSFPELTGVHGQAFFDRNEWLAWSSIYATRATLVRMPSFGDYSIQSPEVLEGYDPRYMPMSPAIRYTLQDQWLIIRGRSSKVARLALQFPLLAQQLVASGHFHGVAHCVGCAEADACAHSQPGFGSPVVWRRIGTAHHLMLVTAAVSALPFP